MRLLGKITFNFCLPFPLFGERRIFSHLYAVCFLQTQKEFLVVTLRFEGEGGIREQPLRNGCKGLKEGSKKNIGETWKNPRDRCAAQHRTAFPVPQGRQESLAWVMSKALCWKPQADTGAPSGSVPPPAK